MRSSFALLAFFAHLFALRIAAHRDWWQVNLPKCWQNCFSKIEDGCFSSSCVCDASQDSSSYLPNVVSCAVSQCEADAWATQLVLGPLQLICLGLSSPISKDTMAAAYAVASKTNRSFSQSTYRAEAKSSENTERKTSRVGNNHELTTTIKSTLTWTTTDSSGNNLEVYIPIVIGPSGVFTGAGFTSTVIEKATSSAAPASIPASPSPSAAASSPKPTLVSPSSTSATNSQRPNNPASGNGSPFENMQAGASTWAVPGPFICLGTLILIFVGS